ncbi:MAG: ACT domain-containing protein [bacterium]
MIKIREQLSVYMRNAPGELARICHRLADADINILGITVADTVDHAVDRLILDDPERARQLLEDEGLLVVTTKVLTIDLENKPGQLAAVAERLACCNINIEYAYCTVSPDQEKGFLVIKVSDPLRVLELLNTDCQ